MHINFKYFIVSIGSIFLALGIGILIGSGLGNNETMQKQNEAIVKDIDEQFNVLKTKDEELIKENKILKENADSYRRYIVSNQAILTANKLSGKNIGIISFDEKDDTDEVDSSITSAGGNIAFKITIKEAIFEKGSAEKINEKLQTNISSNAELISLITDSIKNPTGNASLNALSELGYVKVDKMVGQYESVNNIVFINAAGNKMKNKVNDLEKPIVEIVKNERPVVVVESSANSNESMEEFSKMKIATINNIDQASGQISLVNCLSNDKLTGIYGKDKENNIVTMAVTK
ncbi:copper transporter [Peptostreptococcus russellii]|uniref:Copper transport outer membrane protein, MctB n=1 Tax=Peptostreptococcus russellii TaxID=215200 RepID=A0A1H8EC70_9FIRM|nr:copper transporter [Peptostreptococcus russellii]SEN17112.1 Copper transport outer membrane protein, MctB [Peptostreptococcus russellii]